MNCGKKFFNISELNNKVKKIEENCEKNCLKVKPVKKEGGTRLNEDPCYLSYKYNQSVGPGSYSLQSFKDNNLNVKVKDFVLDQNLKDGFGNCAINSCNIDIDSELRIKSGNMITHDKSVNQLFARPFLTVPYMGSGSGNPCFETMLKPGEDTFQGKACNSKREDPNFIPMVNCLKNNVQNPKNIITEDVSDNWIRGGIPSRQLVRDIEYNERCN